jgi:hypothetical protein
MFPLRGPSAKPRQLSSHARNQFKCAQNPTLQGSSERTRRGETKAKGGRERRHLAATRYLFGRHHAELRKGSVQNRDEEISFTPANVMYWPTLSDDSGVVSARCSVFLQACIAHGYDEHHQSSVETMAQCDTSGGHGRHKSGNEITIG